MTNNEQAEQNYQNRQSKLFEKLGVFWAFGQYQMLKELNKRKLKISEIASIGSGGYLPKKNIEALNAGFRELKRLHEIDLSKTN